MPDKKKPSQTAAITCKKAEEKDRLAQALRANLRRRKVSKPDAKRGTS